MDIKSKVGQKGSQGNASSEYSDYVARCGSWQYGRDAIYNDVESEKKEEDTAFGVTNTTKPSSGA